MAGLEGVHCFTNLDTLTGPKGGWIRANLGTSQSVLITVSVFDIRISLFLGADYTAVERVLTFTPSSSSAEVLVLLQDDRVSEGLEEFFLTLQLTNEMLGLPGEVTRATVFIFDDESE